MLLKLGIRNNDVKKLQEKLGLSVDGYFGPVTEAKIKELQSKNNLTADGVVGDITWNIIFENVDHKFDLNKLKSFIPDNVLEQLKSISDKFGIDNNLRVAHFLGQCAHESMNFKIVKENLNYSADRLKVIFPKYFPGNLNESYANKPEKIASRVYANRMGNGGESSKDGYNYCGRGYIQTTGYDNYKEFDAIVEEDILANPDLVATKYPLMSAAFFFDKNNLWKICDKGIDNKVISELTKKINGGLIGLDERTKNTIKYYKILNA